MTDDKIIWQPKFGSNYEFEVALDREFAKKTAGRKIGPEKQRGLNHVGDMYLKEYRNSFLTPFLFHEDTLFLYHVTLGSGGVWLSTHHDNAKKLLENDNSSEPIIYHSHNIDHSQNAFVLMHLFDKYVEYAQHILKEKV